MKIEKKIWLESFQAILDGKKTYELRLADWSCSEGDFLDLPARTLIALAVSELR